MLVIQRNRPGESLENPAILESQNVLVDFIRPIESLHIPHKAFGIGQLVEHVAEQLLVLAGGD